MDILNRLKVNFATAVLVLGMLVMQPVFSSQPGHARMASTHNDKIEGIWDVIVTVTNCSTGFTMFTFPALHKYEQGGTGQVVPATNPAAMSAHIMLWDRVRPGDFQMTFKAYRFDPLGNYIGWVVTTTDVSISGDEYFGAGVAELYDSSGNLVGASCPVIEGTRFTNG